MSNLKLSLYTDKNARLSARIYIEFEEISKRKKTYTGTTFRIMRCTTSTIGNIECGIAKPSFDLILDIATVLGVHPALLFSSNSIQSDVSKTTEQYELLLEMYNKLQGYFGK